MGAAERLAKELAPVWRNEGRAEGLAEGVAKGAAKGRADVLLRLLGRRFGQLTPEAEWQLRSATVEELDAIVERVLDAQSLEDVLRPRE